MGKRLKQQRRGKGSNAYTRPPKAATADVLFSQRSLHGLLKGEVIEFIDDPGHSAPLMRVRYEDNTESLLLAPEGVALGSRVSEGRNATHNIGSVLPLGEVPDGAMVYNVEMHPGDGGKLARAAGNYATVVAHSGSVVSLMLPSKQSLDLSPECRAGLGVVAGGGAKSKPIMKAGKSYYMMHALNRMWPKNRGVKSNPVDHPFGGKQHHKGASSMTARGAPPGAKVGHIAARRVGRKKRG